jgi:myo-inositol-1(or 4)-monophosphatase
VSGHELDELLEFALGLARAAGKIQLDGLSARPEITLKDVRRELVTPVDQACEQMIVDAITTTYPDHGYLAEEGHESRGAGAGAEWRWIVDPIDGTTNFAHRLPAFAVSIGLERAGEIVLGVVFAPYLDELFYGRRGGGAFLQRGQAAPRPLRVSQTDELADAVLASGFAYVRNDSPNTNLDNWAHLSLKTRGLRRVGSASIDLAYVADGRFDGFWEMHLKPYDVAAGAFLIQEAGGRVTDFFGGHDWLEGQTFVGTNGPLHELVRAELAEVKPDAWVRLPD